MNECISPTGRVLFGWGTDIQIQKAELVHDWSIADFDKFTESMGYAKTRIGKNPPNGANEVRSHDEL